MTVTYATRTRPFTDPHPASKLKLEALERKRAFLNQRKQCIEDLVKDNPAEPDRFYWTMVYDMEHAPTTTGRAQLLEHGIVPVPPQELVLSSELHDELWTIIEALSESGIFLLNTDHLNDANLYARLYYRILDEPCRMMPPGLEAAEYIDCLHPMDLEYPIGKMMAGRNTNADRADEYKRGPVCCQEGILHSRDQYIPRPEWA